MDNEFNERRYSREMPHQKNDRYRVNFIVSCVPDNAVDVLDLGCWDGTHSQKLRKKTNTVYGVESSVSSAEEARKKGIIVAQGLFPSDSIFPGKMFDYIVAGEIIEHVFDTDAFLKGIAKRLKPGGVLVITTPNVASLPRRILLLLGINPILEYRSDRGGAGHVRYFTFRDLRGMLKENSFEIMREASDVVSFDNQGKFFSHSIPLLHKEFGRGIMISARKA
jgi:2-polyprenyl-3-methyl-5-hydroxy-6-metoxy-1,4-benzoquinol methylase